MFVHDLKNLLSVVVGHAEVQMAREAVARDRELAGSLEAIRLAAGRAVELCQAWLDRTREGAGRREAVDLAQVGRTAAAIFRARTGDGVRCRLAGPPSLVVSGQRLDLERAVLNLLWNAREAAGRLPGPVEVELAWGRGALGPWLEVRDNGPGLPEGHIGHLADPYTSSKPGEGRGARGLGLAGAAAIMRLHGGRLSGRNRSDQQGAVLRLDFGLERELDFGAD